MSTAKTPARTAAPTAAAAPAGAPAARETARAPAPGSMIGHNSAGRAVVMTRSGREVSRASAASGINKYHIPPGVIPPGWSWEWKNHTVAGERNDGYAAELLQVGWEPVLAEAHDGVFLPPGAKGNIIRGGLILMERPEVLTIEARRDEKRRADAAHGNAKAQHGKLDTRGAHGVDVDNLPVQARGYAKSSIESGKDVPPPTYERMPIE